MYSNSSFLPIFIISITFPMQMDLNLPKFFSTKLPTAVVLIHQTFLPPMFSYYMVCSIYAPHVKHYAQNCLSLILLKLLSTSSLQSCTQLIHLYMYMNTLNPLLLYLQLQSIRILTKAEKVCFMRIRQLNLQFLPIKLALYYTHCFCHPVMLKIMLS